MSTIASIAKKEDDFLCFRWGGEEYVFVGKITDNIHQIYKKLDAFRRTIENYSFNYKGHVLKVTMTIGLVPYESGMTGDNWFTSADRKLYDGKHSGKNKVVL